MTDKKYALDADQRGDRIRRGRNSPPADVIETKPGSGLATWRKKMAAEKAELMAELEGYRAEATVEVREGREFVVVRLPDKYQWP